MVLLAIEQPGSSSHGDTVVEESAFVVTKNGDSICSIPHKQSKIQFIIVLLVNFIHGSNITIVFIQFFSGLVIVEISVSQRFVRICMFPEFVR